MNESHKFLQHLCGIALVGLFFGCESDSTFIERQNENDFDTIVYEKVVKTMSDFFPKRNISVFICLLALLAIVSCSSPEIEPVPDVQEEEIYMFRTLKPFDNVPNCFYYYENNNQYPVVMTDGKEYTRYHEVSPGLNELVLFYEFFSIYCRQNPDSNEFRRYGYAQARSRDNKSFMVDELQNYVFNFADGSVETNLYSEDVCSYECYSYSSLFAVYVPNTTYNVELKRVDGQEDTERHKSTHIRYLYGMLEEEWMSLWDGNIITIGTEEYYEAQQYIDDVVKKGW